jgi:predicted dehydrogenase
MLRVGIIGLGGIANSHCRGIAELEDVKVMAVADLMEERRREFMAQYDIPKGYATHTELLADPEIDAVGVVLGHMLHHRLTVDACRAGKHVLVEKPMAISMEQCDEMVAAARENGVKLMVGLTNHFSPTNRKAREILDSGELGPVITAVNYMSKRWGYPSRRAQYRSRYHGGGMWLTNGVHVVDRLTWFMASQALSVSAAIGNRSYYQAADDYGSAMIRYKNGQVGLAVAVAYKDGGPNHDLNIICTEGSLHIGRGGGGLVEAGVWVGKGDQWEKVAVEDEGSNFAREWEAFATAIERNIEPPASGVYGRHIMEILFAAEESAITNQEVRLSSGPGWFSQESGEVATYEHGWY